MTAAEVIDEYVDPTLERREFGAAHENHEDGYWAGESEEVRHLAGQHG